MVTSVNCGSTEFYWNGKEENHFVFWCTTNETNLMAFCDVILMNIFVVFFKFLFTLNVERAEVMRLMARPIGVLREIAVEGSKIFLVWLLF